MSARTAKYHLPAGTTADGTSDLLVTPEHGPSTAAPAHGWVRATWDTQDVHDRRPFGAEENE